MTPEEFKSLDTGDCVRNKDSVRSYIVMANYGERVTAARTVDITNPSEWDLVVKVTGRRTEHDEEQHDNQ